MVGLRSLSDLSSATAADSRRADRDRKMRASSIAIPGYVHRPEGVQ